MAKNYGKENDEEFMKNENVRNYIKKGIESEKAINFIVDNAKMKKAVKKEEKKEDKKEDNKKKEKKADK